jgi:hypothetical protein
VVVFLIVNDRTRLFREYKLCRLLLRPLDDRRSTTSLARARHSAAAGLGRRRSAKTPSASSNGVARHRSSLSSSMVRGYSRQSEESCSASSLSVDNSGAKDNTDVHEIEDEDEYDDDDERVTAPGGAEGGKIASLEYQLAARRSALFRYLRPGSRAYSQPIYLSAGKRSLLEFGLVIILSSFDDSTLSATCDVRDCNIFVPESVVDLMCNFLTLGKCLFFLELKHRKRKTGC